MVNKINHKGIAYVLPFRIFATVCTAVRNSTDSSHMAMRVEPINV